MPPARVVDSPNRLLPSVPWGPPQLMLFDRFNAGTRKFREYWRPVPAPPNKPPGPPRPPPPPSPPGPRPPPGGPPRRPPPPPPPPSGGPPPGPPGPPSGAL